MFSSSLLKQQLQEKRDPEWEKKLVEWIEQVSGEKCDADIGISLKSGVLLCK